MTGLGQSIFEEGIQKGIEALILDNIEEKIPKGRIIRIFYTNVCRKVVGGKFSGFYILQSRRER